MQLVMTGAVTHDLFRHYILNFLWISINLICILLTMYHLVKLYRWVRWTFIVWRTLVPLSKSIRSGLRLTGSNPREKSDVPDYGFDPKNNPDRFDLKLKTLNFSGTRTNDSDPVVINIINDDFFFCRDFSRTSEDAVRVATLVTSILQSGRTISFL